MDTALIILTSVLILWIFDVLWYSITLGRDLMRIRKEIRRIDLDIAELHKTIKTENSPPAKRAESKNIPSNVVRLSDYPVYASEAMLPPSHTDSFDIDKKKKDV